MIVRVFLVVVAFTLLGIGSAWAASVEDFCSRPIRVALFEFGLLYKASTNTGIDPYLLDEIHKRTGCEFERIVLPRNRIWAELENGSLDLGTGAIPTPERRQFGFLLPYLKTRNLALVRKSLAPHIVTVGDLEQSKVRIGVIRGFRHEAVYDEIIARLAQKDRVVRAVDVPEILRLFDKGVVDVIFSQPIVFGQYLSKDYISGNVAFRDWAPKEDVSVGALILSRKSFTSDQAQKWDDLIVRMQKDRTLLKILETFVSRSQAMDLVYTGPRSPQ
jgi:polar amino acid transport system substrate-binding protein